MIISAWFRPMCMLIVNKLSIKKMIHGQTSRIAQDTSSSNTRTTSSGRHNHDDWMSFVRQDWISSVTRSATSNPFQVFLATDLSISLKEGVGLRGSAVRPALTSSKAALHIPLARVERPIILEILDLTEIAASSRYSQLCNLRQGISVNAQSANQSFEFASLGGVTGGMIRLILTDGSKDEGDDPSALLEVCGIELSPISGIRSWKVGGKVLFRGGIMRRGVLFLDEKSISYLGDGAQHRMLTRSDMVGKLTYELTGELPVVP